jgi:hypothetical protein
MRTDEITVSGRAGRVPHPFAFCAKGGMGAPAFRVFCEGRGFYAGSLRFNFGRLPIRSRLRAVHCNSISTTPSYSQKHRTFPHESPADQWFDETQFESYRALGEFIGIAAAGEIQKEIEAAWA